MKTTNQTLSIEWARYANTTEKVLSPGYLFTWFICFSLVISTFVDFLFPGNETEARMIPQIFRAFIVLLMFIYLVRGGIEQSLYCSGIAVCLTFFAIMLLIHVICAAKHDYVLVVMFARCLYWIVGALTFYRMTLNKQLTINHIQLIAAVLILIVSIYSIFDVISHEYELRRNSYGYLILWLIPLLLIKPRYKISFFFLLSLTCFAIVFSLKRGTLIALVLSSAIFLIMSIKVNPRQRKLFLLLFFALVLVVLATSALRWEDMSVRWADFTEADKIGSGRGTFYRIVIQGWLDGSFNQKTFGYGFYSVPDLLGIYWLKETYAHSDWLEILYDYGLVGVVLFAGVHLAIFNLLRKGYQNRHHTIPALAMGYCIFFLVNIYSICLMSVITIFFALLLGYSAARIEMDSPLQTKNEHLRNMRQSLPSRNVPKYQIDGNL
jgi:O-antigen ligase